MNDSSIRQNETPVPEDVDLRSVLELGRRMVTDVLEPMKRTFVGKDEIIDLMGVSLAAGENLFLLGPPGTAKSALVSELGRRLEGRTFEYLLTRFTEPNELFGPFDVRKLRDGELVTNTEGMLPEASLVFLDELLNANSAILNSLLGVLNERVLRRGKERWPLPTLMVVGASNRLPEDDTLGALFDRFMLRVMCENVPADQLGEVLAAGWQLESSKGDRGTSMHLEDARRLNRALTHIDLLEIRVPLASMVMRLRQAGIPVSDRRAVKMQRLAASSALLCGRAAARLSDLWVFRHIWDTVEQREVLASLVDEALRPVAADAADHPRSRSSDAPDPERMARDLERIESSLGAKMSAVDRAILVDHLGVISGRCQWVKDATRRAYLVERVEKLFKRAGAEGEES